MKKLFLLNVLLLILPVVSAVEGKPQDFTGDYVLVTLSLLIFFFGLIFLFKKWRAYIMNKELASKIPKEEKKKEENRWYDFLRPQIPGKIRHLKYKRKHKVEDQKHHDFFTEFGATTKKIDNRLFNKIKRMAKYHGPEKIFRNLEEVTKVMKEKEKKFVEKKEIKNSISKLKKMIKK